MVKAKAWAMIPHICGTDVEIEIMPILQCRDCKNAECEGRNGMIVCGIDGTAHKPEWFCADGEAKE